MLNWQEQMSAEQENSQMTADFAVGIVGAVYTDGLTIRLPGETAAGSKRYRYNLDGTFSAGDRVLLGRVAGSYVVICRF